jgi:hypothetical protein
MSSKKQKHPYRELFSTLKNLPFLFVGSGLSRRYLNLPNWEELLRHFASAVYPDNPLALEVFTKAKSEVDWPEVSSRIESEFNQLWLTSPDYKEQREQYQVSVKAGISPFKIAIASFFSEAERTTEHDHLNDELSCLTNVGKRSVAGVITTNYDQLLEEVFNKYETFIGQEQLLFAPTQGVAEIYKIHGCCTQPGSVVINSADYEAFDKRNAYLAAKLLTVFVEHPVIFLGYSLSDPNVQSILGVIIDCLSQENLKVLKSRLIFVEYSPDENQDATISEHSLNFDGGKRSVQMTKITLHDFLPLYSELLSQKYEYNPKLLRQLKRDIYKLVTTNEPVERFQITDIEDDDELEKVGVLAGVGVVQIAGGPSDRGHHIPEARKLFCDVINDDGDFDVKSLVEDALTKLLRTHGNSLPAYKYLSAYRQEFGKEPPIEILNRVPKDFDGFLNKSLRKQRTEGTFDTMVELLSAADSEIRKIELLPRLTTPSEHVEEIGELLKEYIQAHPDVWDDKTSGRQTSLKRAVKIYDWLKYGQ